MSPRDEIDEIDGIDGIDKIDEIHGLATGAGVLVGFGVVLWALAGRPGLPASLSVALIVLLIAGTIGFIVGITLLWRQAASIPSGNSTDAGVAGTNANTQFAVVFTVEIVAIALAVWLLIRTGHTALIAPVVAVIVGLHFLPLAALFQAPAYYITGIAMSLLAVVCIVAVVVGAHPGETPARLWSSVVGLGSAAILWATALWILMQGYGIARRASYPLE